MRTVQAADGLISMRSIIGRMAKSGVEKRDAVQTQTGAANNNPGIACGSRDADTAIRPVMPFCPSVGKRRVGRRRRGPANTGGNEPLRRESTHTHARSLFFIDWGGTKTRIRETHG